MLAKPGDKSFAAGGVGWHGLYGVSETGYHAFALGSGDLMIEYVASIDGYRVTQKGGPVSVLPASSLAFEDDDETDYYIQAGGHQALLYMTVPKVNKVPLSYTRFANFGHQDDTTKEYQTYMLVWGVPTVASDMPKTGSATYALTLSGTIRKNGVINPLWDSNGTLTANFGSGTVATTLNLALEIENVLTPLGTLNGTGTIVSAGFNGTLSGSDGGSGVFGGGFFGPKAAEVGYTWWYDGPELRRGQGQAAGVKN